MVLPAAVVATDKPRAVAADSKITPRVARSLRDGSQPAALDTASWIGRGGPLGGTVASTHNTSPVRSGNGPSPCPDRIVRHGRKRNAVARLFLAQHEPLHAIRHAATGLDALPRCPFHWLSSRRSHGTQEHFPSPGHGVESFQRETAPHPVQKSCRPRKRTIHGAEDISLRRKLHQF